MPYAVKVGREMGIFDSWQACQAQVNGFPDAQFKKCKIDTPRPKGAEILSGFGLSR